MDWRLTPCAPRVAPKTGAGNKHYGITSVHSREDEEEHGGRRKASSRRYYSVNANVNTAADVFRKAQISRRLLILVIAATYTPDALNVRECYAAGSQGETQSRELLPAGAGKTWTRENRVRAGYDDALFR